MDREWLIGLVSAILSGTGVGAITAWTTGRSTARKIGSEAKAIDSKTPVEVDSIAIQGAESAVRMLQQTNETLISENDRLNKENERLRTELARLEVKVHEQGELLHNASQSLATATRSYQELYAEFEAFRSSIPNPAG
jgi:predicted RNase H-like nuclease (RuvC/YqgF family)